MIPPNVIVMTTRDREVHGRQRVAELADQWQLANIALYFRPSVRPKARAEIHGMREVLAEFLVGTGPWLVMQDDVQFTSDPDRTGAIGDLHLYGGFPVGSNPIQLDYVEPDAMLIQNHDTRKQLLEAFGGDETVDEAWMPWLRTLSVTWDAEPTIEYAEVKQ